MKRFLFFCAFLAAAAVLAFFSWRALDGEKAGSLEDIEASIAGGEASALNEIIDEMTLEEKVGQMFLGCFYDGFPDPSQVSGLHLGGVLLFSSAFEDSSPNETAALTEELHSSMDIPPLTTVDEEGGTVVRISSHKAFRSEPFKSPRELYNEGGLDLIISDTHQKNQLLKALGIDVNLAPVCDISLDPSDFMYSRSLGQDSRTTARYASAVVEACLEDGTGCVLKHFPGYGSTGDTHKGLAADNRTLKEIEERDLVPFKAAIDAGAPAVLISHNIVSAFDSRRPASLSPAVHVALRHDLAFDGVVITDDLSMGAVKDYSSYGDSAVTAVLAGNDMICTGDFAVQSRALLEAVRDGLIKESRIDSSLRRILLWKADLGLIDLS